MEDDIETLKNEITNIEKGEEEKEYYTSTGNILFDYYDNTTQNKQKGIKSEKVNPKGSKDKALEDLPKIA